MGDDPVGTLIGVILIGLGAVLLFGAIKNKKVFGEHGIIPEAISTGSLGDMANVPAAFPSLAPEGEKFGGKVEDKTPDEAKSDKVTRDLATAGALSSIAQSDQNLADNISQRLADVGPKSNKQSLMALAQLLALADAKRHSLDSEKIRQYVKDATGESI